MAWQVADDDASERVATAPTDGTGGTGSSTGTGGDVQDLPLEGTRWWLVTAEDDGQVVDLGDEEQIGLQLDADVPCASLSDQLDCETLPVLRASDACNGVARQYSIDGDTIEVGRQVLPRRSGRAVEPLVQLLGRVYHPDPGPARCPDRDHLRDPRRLAHHPPRHRGARLPGIDRTLRARLPAPSSTRARSTPGATA